MKNNLRFIAATFFVLAISLSTSFGKSYTIPVHTLTINKTDSTPGDEIQLRVINDSNNILTVKWAIIDDGFKNCGWDYSFCDLNQCFVTAYPQYNTDLLTAKDTAAFSITILHYYGKAVSATMSIAVWDSKDPHNVDTLTLVINATRLGIAPQQIPSTSISVFPNPASDYVNINVNQFGFTPEKAFIYNTLGQTMYEQNINGGSSSLPVFNLPKGVYYISLRDKYGRESMNQFVKE